MMCIRCNKRPAMKPPKGWKGKRKPRLCATCGLKAIQDFIKDPYDHTVDEFLEGHGKLKIYVASSWRNQHQPTVVQLLREAGHQVYDFRNPTPTDHGFAWSDIDKNWQQWTPLDYVMKLEHPLAVKGFDNDFEAMKNADVCVLVLPSGRSSHMEAGWFVGAGKKLIIFYLYSERIEPELMYKIAYRIVTTGGQLVTELEALYRGGKP